MDFTKGSVRFNVSDTPGIRKILFLFLILLLILFTPCFHSSLFPEINVAFDRILQDREYANSEVSSILQDSKGFIWFGTSDGLFRFDGYDCVGYKYIPEDDKSLSNSNVNCLCLDSNEDLWIGTKSGLNKFNREKETFIHYLHSNEDPKNPGNSNVEAIYEDSGGILWIGTEKEGLISFDREKEEFRIFKHNDQKKDSLSNDNVRAIYEDSGGVLWIGTEVGLNRFNRETGTFESFKADPHGDGTLSHNYIWAICEDREGILWLGTWGGLNRYDRDTGQFTHYDVDTEVSKNKITSIYEDRKGMLWVGTRGNGFCYFDRETSKFTCFKRDVYNPRSLNHNMVNTIFVDRTGIIWIGTLGGGLNTYNPRKEKFFHYLQHPDKPDSSLSDSTVLSIYEDPDEAGEVIWVGTYSGLNRIDRKKNKVKAFKNVDGDPQSISNNVVRCIAEDTRNILWLGTDNGLNRFDRETGKFSSFHFEAGNPKSISYNGISAIFEDSRGVLWIGTPRGGLNRFDGKEKSFTHFKSQPGNPDSLSKDSIFCIFEQPRRNKAEYVLWIGTYGGGLNKFFVEENRFLSFQSNPGQTDGLSNDTIRVIYEDREGILWLGNDGGLNRFNPETSKFSAYTEKEGLANNVVYGILEDETGHLWLSTGNGLSRFDMTDKVFKNYNISDGLQVTFFTHNSYFKSIKSGEMFLGGSNGFISFYPSEIKSNKNVPNIVITDFKIFNQSVGIGEDKKLSKPITETNEIRLSHLDYWFSFEFSALDYSWPENNRYEYKMEGYDEDWKTAEADNRIASYVNTAAGTYTFRVRGSNNDGIWNNEGVSLKVIITPPLWKTPWFLGVMGFLLIFCAVAGYLWRTKLLRKKLAEKERVQKILEQSRDEMERSRNLAEFRSAENEKLIAAISSIFIAVDADGKVFQLNHSSIKFFRMSENHVKDRPFVKLLEDHIDLEKLEEIIQLGLHREKPSSSIEIPVRFEMSNEPNLLLATINPIIDRSGRKFGFLLLAEDITYRKKEQIQQFLSQKLEALGQMAAGIAHEIRSPLQYIGDNGRFLQEAFGNLTELCNKIRDAIKKAEDFGDKIEAKELKQFLDESDFEFFTEEIPKASEQIVNGVSRVSNIVKSMNEFSHTGDGVSGKSDLNDMLKTTLVVAHNRLKKVAEIETDYAPDLPAIPCGMGELNQVFLNLLLNAADAIAETGERGVIKVSTAKSGDELIVRIADNGNGIPEENKDKIFTPFFTTKGVGKGTGQGLTFSYRIVVDRHKGRLYFDSQVGKGTTFYIHLPIVENPGES